MKKLERFILRDELECNKSLKMAKHTITCYWPNGPQLLEHFYIMKSGTFVLLKKKIAYPSSTHFDLKKFCFYFNDFTKRFDVIMIHDELFPLKTPA